jgi:hypothetical protein
VQREEIGQLKLANIIELPKKLEGDAEQRKIEALTMNDERLEKRVTERAGDSSCRTESSAGGPLHCWCILVFLCT